MKPRDRHDGADEQSLAIPISDAHGIHPRSYPFSLKRLPLIRKNEANVPRPRRQDRRRRQSRSPGRRDISVRKTSRARSPHEEAHPTRSSRCEELEDGQRSATQCVETQGVGRRRDTLVFNAPIRATSGTAVQPIYLGFAGATLNLVAQCDGTLVAPNANVIFETSSGVTLKIACA